jgi:hypothetical protein
MISTAGIPAVGATIFALVRAELIALLEPLDGKAKLKIGGVSVRLVGRVPLLILSLVGLHAEEV